MKEVEIEELAKRINDYYLQEVSMSQRTETPIRFIKRVLTEAMAKEMTQSDYYKTWTP